MFIKCLYSLGKCQTLQGNLGTSVIQPMLQELTIEWRGWECTICSNTRLTVMGTIKGGTDNGFLVRNCKVMGVIRKVPP